MTGPFTSVGLGDTSTANASAGTEAISAAANAADAFNNFASTIEAIMARLGLSTEEGEQAQGKEVTIQELLAEVSNATKAANNATSSVARVSTQMAVLQGWIEGLAARLANVESRVGDSYTAPERMGGVKDMSI